MRWSGVSLAVAFVLLFATTLPASSRNLESKPIQQPAAIAGAPEADIQRALQTLLAEQIDEVPGWPWIKGHHKPAPNLSGIVALSLLRAYERHPKPATWVTLVQYRHHVEQLYAPDDRLPYKADIEFLSELARSGVDPDARALAEKLFGRIRHVSSTGTAEYARIANGRAKTPEIIGYDVALAIRAALAVEERSYAAALADAAISDGHLRLDDPADSFEVTAVGALLHALAKLGRSQDEALMQSAAASLLHAQAPNGSWAHNNTQATAHALLGLSASDSSGERGIEAQQRAREWLLERQLPSGAWAAYHDGLPEPFVGPIVPLAEAEALLALLAQ